MFRLITGGEVYAPEPLGKKDVLIVRGSIGIVGSVDVAAVRALGLPVDVIDATGCLVAPGFVDPHAHIIGTGGEQGFASRTRPLRIEDLVGAGITTMVGCLGTDDTTRTLPALVAQARQLTRQGATVYAYTGSFHVPVVTLLGTVREDLLFIPEFIGVGELAISDIRATEPTAHELVRLISSTLLGGLFAEKAGVVHFHVGPGKRRLSLLREAMESDDVPPRHLYPTHINRSDELMSEAVDLAKRGCFVDLDCIDPGQGKWIRKYLDQGGPPGQLTMSSDAQTPGGSTEGIRRELVTAIKEFGFKFEEVLPLTTKNPATALKLPQKGRIARDCDGDIVVYEPGSYRIRDVLMRGRVMMRNGELCEIDEAVEQP